MTSSTRLSPAARIPPPLLFVTAFLVGLLLQRWLLGSATSPSPAVRWPAIVVTGLGMALALWALGLFARRRTTIVPHGVASTLVIRGPYRLTRNPMYVSLLTEYVGVTVWTGTWVAFALVAIPLLVLDRVIIPMEEAQLRQRFGGSYATYCRRVRRWF
jgi:protein-S-isoprenylcysteine O-methyltransferase Ste14